MNIIPIQLIAQQAETAQAVAPNPELSIGSVILDSSGMVLFVLLVLIFASIASWFLIGYKALLLKRAQRQTVVFVDRFWATRDLDEVETSAQSLPNSPLSNVFLSGYEELRKVIDDRSQTDRDGLENVERAMRRAGASEFQSLERFLPFLATVGSAAPFVGLFGTVWGIMTAFMKISALHEAGIDVVAGPIAEALIATAVGLLAAIPAVVAYNFLSSAIGRLEVDAEGFVSDFLNVLRRHFVP